RLVRRRTPAAVRGGARRPALAPARRSPGHRVHSGSTGRLCRRAQVRHRRARRAALRRSLPRVHAGRRPHHVPRRLGAGARVEHSTGPGAAVRGGQRVRARRVPGRSGGLARRAGRPTVTRPARRSWLVAGAAALVVVLVGGRWLALETAERAWAASVPGGQVYVVGHDVARLVSGLILLLAVAWGTGNVFFVYRAIGSVQLPRRLGDLEIVEAVLDPAETVAGLHGALDRAALEVRLPAAPLVTAFALVATLASLVWALRDGPALLFASWSVLLGAVGIVYVVVPGVWRGAGPQTAA